ncbi:MAG: PH domain-containing protein [Tannerellaceae bacterium]|jgi:hypothetical protein|nr:PH domain-containing protein [Tannerellaceae bacterium]
MNTKINIRWSKQTIFITVIVAVILIFAEVALINIYIGGGNSSALFAIILIASLFLAFMLSAPLSIALNDSQLVLRKVLGKIVINYSQISSVKLYTPESGDIRIFGSGGFCGYIGIFSSRKIGKYLSYVGDPKQAFLIRTKSGKNYVFSCENVAFVIEIINKYLS